MDITTQHYLDLIKKSPNKKTAKCRKFIEFVRKEISGLRFTAMKSENGIKKLCNEQANALEKSLNSALKGQ